MAVFSPSFNGKITRRSFVKEKHAKICHVIGDIANESNYGPEIPRRGRKLYYYNSSYGSHLSSPAKEPSHRAKKL